MTITFQGHVHSLSSEGAAPGRVLVTLQTPMEEANGRTWTIGVPKADAGHWLPGRAVSFTLYAFDIPDAAPIQPTSEEQP